ncbi:MAG TPA: PA2169 family four-helix-bundle protein [Candidatus Angelobacter sp.]|nr:PA2169 family four-helix-bundle protein [Candidatus Angelobacter sp.]
MAHTDWMATVERLIETCKDGEDGFREAAHKATRKDLKQYFETQSRNRAQFGNDLGRELSRLSGREARGSLAAAMHRGWLDLLAAFGAGDESVLNAVRQGERSAIQSYEEALRQPLPPQIERLARTQLESIERGLNKLTDRAA